MTAGPSMRSKITRTLVRWIARPRRQWSVAARPPGGAEAVTPRVSIVLPFFNAQAYLAEAIESVLAQTFSGWELLLLDDGSTDSSLDIAMRYAGPRVRVVRNDQNRGLAGTLNRGFALASGEFIARLDADDAFEPQRLETQVAFLDDHPKVALVGSWYSVIDSVGRQLQIECVPTAPSELHWELFFSNPFATSTVLLRKEAVAQMPVVHDESLPYAHDYDLWSRIAETAAVANIPEVLARRRVHPDSLTNTFADGPQEFRRLRVNRIAPLLGWDSSDSETCGKRLWAMASVYYGWKGPLEPEVLLGGAYDVLALRAAFGKPIPPSASGRRAERALRARLAGNLVRLSTLSGIEELHAGARRIAGALRHAPRLLRPELSRGVTKTGASSGPPPFPARMRKAA